MPLVSVLLPVYNAERYLREAVDSILSQTLSDFEMPTMCRGPSGSSDKWAIWKQTQIALLSVLAC